MAWAEVWVADVAWAEAWVVDAAWAKVWDAAVEWDVVWVEVAEWVCPLVCLRLVRQQIFPTIQQDRRLSRNWPP